MLHLPYRELPVEDPGTPDSRSAWRFMLWLARQQTGTIAGATLCATAWMLSQALLWAAVGGAIDHGIAGHSLSRLLEWAGLILVLGVVQALSGGLAAETEPGIDVEVFEYGLDGPRPGPRASGGYRSALLRRHIRIF